MSDVILGIRKKIDAIDEQIIQLLEQRAEHAKAIGVEKRQNPQTSPSFYDPEREASILKRIEQKAKGSFPIPAIPLVFREIMSACRSLEADLKVAFLGPSGTFTQIAAFQSFGHSNRMVEASTIDGVFDLVARGETEYGVVPLENSCEGGVIQTLDALLKTDGVYLRRETVIKIHHCLISPLENLSQVKKVYSHPAALAQCHRWLSENLRGAELIVSRSTAAAARTAMEDEGSAAIASSLSAELLGLKILREGIQDRDDNATRFVILSQSDGPATGSDRTSIIVSLKEGPGALMRALKTFEDAGIAVSRAESRASSDKFWRYVYFIDFDGHRQDPAVAAVLETLAGQCERLKILGSYPKEISR